MVENKRFTGIEQTNIFLNDFQNLLSRISTWTDQDIKTILFGTVITYVRGGSTFNIMNVVV